MVGRSLVSGMLVCATVAGALLSARFARSVVQGLLVSAGLGDALPNLTVVALWVTHPGVLVPVALLVIAAAAATELRARNESGRLLVQVAVLLVVLLLLAVAIAGLVLPFVVPVVTIP